MVEETVDMLRVRTAEGVNFSFPLASPVMRLAAWAIDKLAIGVAWTVVSALISLLGLFSEDLARGVIAVGYFVLSTGYGIAL
jgi:hypothetical protein